MKYKGKYALIFLKAKWSWWTEGSMALPSVVDHNTPNVDLSIDSQQIVCVENNVYV